MLSTCYAGNVLQGCGFWQPGRPCPVMDPTGMLPINVSLMNLVQMPSKRMTRVIVPVKSGKCWSAVKAKRGNIRIAKQAEVGTDRTSQGRGDGSGSNDGSSEQKLDLTLD